MDISDFFEFSPSKIYSMIGELRHSKMLKAKIIPVWKRDRLKKLITIP